MDTKINSLFFTNFWLLFILDSVLLYHHNNNNLILLFIVILILLLINLIVFFLSNYYVYKKKETKNEQLLNIYKKLTLFTFILFFIITAFVSPFLFAFILIMFISILWHEWWHALFMKLFWVKLVDFSIWFWQPIFTKKIWKIEFNIRNILLWGYVKPIDDKITKDLWKLKENSDYINEIEKKYNIKKSELYLSKKLWQKILILIWWVLFNLTFAILSIWMFIHLIWGWQQHNLHLTKSQKVFLHNQRVKNKGDKKILSYIMKKMPPTIWLHTRKLSGNLINNTVYETKNAMLLTFYSMDYAVHHPSAFLHFKSFVWIWKDIYKLENHNLMNWKILLMVIALINISLFLINITPLPALDWWQIIKELIAHTAHQIWKK